MLQSHMFLVVPVQFPFMSIININLISLQGK